MSLRLLLAKDLSREWQAKEGLQAGIVLVATFALLYLFVFPDLRTDVRAGAAVLWTPVLYGAAAIAGRGMATEHDRGTLELLRAAPVPRVLHGTSRTLVDGLLMLIVAAVTAGVARILFGVPMDPALLGIMALAVVGLAAVGSLTGALAAQTRASSILLPVLLVPVAAPLLIAGVDATLAALVGQSVRTPVLLMAGYDLLAIGITWLLWPVVLEGD